ncbi:hypothetical protein DF3PB_1090017 [uncultured Defluviicoccus sp.]|uniref:Uncharacterized protein n=1 Tax=metagenome TaxID=256318 RepID=A0A380TA68_9ZZZZ|nr:hypothetical protein DF3PB_1090017 [uncultured Defluviicoccus sp.]
MFSNPVRHPERSEGSKERFDAREYDGTTLGFFTALRMTELLGLKGLKTRPSERLVWISG